MNTRAQKFLTSLLQTPSTSGSEMAIQDHCQDYLKDRVDLIDRDVHGNQYYHRLANQPRRIMLCAHADEIGLMVQGADEFGFLRIVPIGGVDVSTLSGQRVRVAGIPGVIGRKAIHLRTDDEAKQGVEMHQLWVDIGATSRKEALGRVEIGAPIILDTPITWLRNNRIAARGLDNRIGVFILMETMRRLGKVTLDVDVVAVTSVQEEIGLRGAHTSSHQVAPHIAVNLDVSFATDHPLGEPERWGDTRLSRGPILARGPGVHPTLFSEFTNIAKDARIPTQVRAEPDASGTDASALQLAHNGVAVMDIGIPNRYMHTAVEMVCLDDVVNCIELLTRWVQSCQPDTDYIGV